MKKLEQIRRAAVEDFNKRKPRLMAMLREDFGDEVKDLRLLGSVLDPRRFTEDSDIDVAVIITEGQCGKVNQALYIEGYPLVIVVLGDIWMLDPITMDEEGWDVWSKGRKAA